MAPFEVSFAFLGTLRLLLGFEMSSKVLLGPTYVDYQLCFRNYSLTFFKTILALHGYFWTFKAIFWVEDRFKNVFGTYYCRLSILVLEVKSYLFNSDTIGAFLHFSGLFLGLVSGPKTFWGLLTSSNNFYFGAWLDIAILMNTKSSAFDFDFY